jgi:superfamily II DNA/RNA helicase
MNSFSRLGLAEPIAAALASFGFEGPTPVQAETIPLLLSKRDAIVESETGTGKTLAYLAPAFQLVSVLERRGAGEPGLIVAAPTQELAVQIGRESERLAKAAGLSLATVVLLGGTSLEKQAAKLKARPEVVVGTLGRLADLVALGKLKTSALKILVLDEADRLFSKETEELARALLASAPSSCARVLVSATVPERLRRGIRPLLRQAVEVTPLGETVLSGSIEHWCFYCDPRKRLDFVRRFDAAVHPARCLLFLTMASRVEKAALALASFGLGVGAIHAGLDKEERRVALERFAGGELRYLLTSDLGARGLDIQGISHVLSLDLPEEPTIYTHRAGRTGRAGAKGVSVVLADGFELARASKIATKRGFVFRCKVLERGSVLEPTSEEFFARATEAEGERAAARLSKMGEETRRPRARPHGPRPQALSDRALEGKAPRPGAETAREDRGGRKEGLEPPQARRSLGPARSAGAPDAARAHAAPSAARGRGAPNAARAHAADRDPSSARDGPSARKETPRARSEGSWSGRDARKPVVHDRRPALNDHRSAASDRRPGPNDRRPMSSDRRSAQSGVRADREPDRPRRDSRRPPREDSQPGKGARPAGKGSGRANRP